MVLLWTGAGVADVDGAEGVVGVDGVEVLLLSGAGVADVDDAEGVVGVGSVDSADVFVSGVVVSSFS